MFECLTVKRVYRIPYSLLISLLLKFIPTIFITCYYYGLQIKVLSCSLSTKLIQTKTNFYITSA